MTDLRLREFDPSTAEPANEPDPRREANLKYLEMTMGKHAFIPTRSTRTVPKHVPKPKDQVIAKRDIRRVYSNDGQEWRSAADCAKGLSVEPLTVLHALSNGTKVRGIRLSHSKDLL